MKLRALVHVDGPALDPARWPADVMERRRASSVGRVWRSLYQQDPTDIDGNLFKEVWWQVYEEPPTAFVRTGIFIDSAYKVGVASDYSVCAVWAKSSDGHVYLLDIRRRRVEFPELLAMVEGVYEKWKRLRPVVVIEDKASGQALVPMIRKKHIPSVAWKHNLKGLRANASKIARMEAVTPLIERGLAHIPAKAAWREDWLDEHRAVPTGMHDDQVDTTVMAIDYFLGARVADMPADAVFHDKDIGRVTRASRITAIRRDAEEEELEEWQRRGLL